MKTLTKILGVVAIAGALTSLSGYANKNQTLFVIGASGLTLGGVGYILAKSKEYENTLH
jgi:hypothetical protein